MNTAAVKRGYNDMAAVHRPYKRQRRNATHCSDARAFNNWVKTTLIRENTPAGATVLDLCGGRGGDVGKWDRADIRHLVFADIAEEGVQEARRRHCGSYSVDYLVVDCHTAALRDALARTGHMGRFSVVSCQFALHYAFESEAQIRCLLQTVHDALLPGGCFIGTIPDADEILRRGSGDRDGYSITLHESTIQCEFGAAYRFTLTDAVPGLDEYLVRDAVLQRLALSVGLVAQRAYRFDDFYTARGRDTDAMTTLARMRQGKRGPLSPIDHDLITLYKTFVFHRSSAPVDVTTHAHLSGQSV